MKSWHRMFAAGLVLLILPTLAHGWWRGGFFHRGGYYRAAYYGGYYGGGYGGYGYYPVTYAPAYAVYPSSCGDAMPVAAAPTYATPRPAPPSQTDEPSAAASTRKGPKITESRSLGGAYATDDKAGPLRVGFWNITGKDVNLKVNGQSHVVPRNRTLNLRLDRNFTWQAAGEAKQEQVAENQTTHEVILR